MTKKLTKEEFIQKAISIHGNKYDYSKVVYINSWTKVIIICPIHGEFKQIPNNHLKEQGCPNCFGNYNYTTNKFIEKAREVHGNKYDYSKVVYINNKEKVTIICPIHGEFKQTPGNHLSGYNCKICDNYNKKLSQEEFIQKAIEVHGNKYDYSKINYVNSYTNVTIICKEHGKFDQLPRNHLSGTGCSKCYFNSKILTQEEFIKRVITTHGNKYNYSKTIYKNITDYITIICPKHGEFQQRSDNHLKGSGCKKCYKEKIKMSINDFLKLFYEIHGDSYQVIEETYLTARLPIDIICNYHGRVTVKYAYTLLSGSGCPKCSGSGPEKLISNYLDELNIKFIKEYTLPFYKFRWDFYLPDYNIFIEFHGEQHYKHIKYFGDIESFNKLKLNDKIKINLVKGYNGKLITLNYSDLNNKNIKNKLLYILRKYNVVN